MGTNVCGNNIYEPIATTAFYVHTNTAILSIFCGIISLLCVFLSLILTRPTSCATVMLVLCTIVLWVNVSARSSLVSPAHTSLY